MPIKDSYAFSCLFDKSDGSKISGNLFRKCCQNRSIRSKIPKQKCSEFRDQLLFTTPTCMKTEDGLYFFEVLHSTCRASLQQLDEQKYIVQIHPLVRIHSLFEYIWKMFSFTSVIETKWRICIFSLFQVLWLLWIDWGYHADAILIAKSHNSIVSWSIMYRWLFSDLQYWAVKLYTFAVDNFLQSRSLLRYTLKKKE